MALTACGDRPRRESQQAPRVRRRRCSRSWVPLADGSRTASKACCSAKPPANGYETLLRRRARRSMEIREDLRSPLALGITQEIPLGEYRTTPPVVMTLAAAAARTRSQDRARASLLRVFAIEPPSGLASTSALRAANAVGNERSGTPAAVRHGAPRHRGLGTVPLLLLSPRRGSAAETPMARAGFGWAVLPFSG